jgi:hypothetical protein
MLERADHVRKITTRPRLMTVALAYPHIEKPPGEPARLKRLPRVRVAQIVMDYLAHGWSPDEMCRQQAHLRLAEAHAAMTYFYDNEEEIEREIQDELQQLEDLQMATPRSPLFHRLRAKGER